MSTSFSTVSPTVAVTAYPSAANVVAPNSGAGMWSFQNSGTIDFLVSLDGSTDAFRVPAGGTYTTPSYAVPSRLFAKLASAGSQTLNANYTARGAAMGGG